MTSLYYVIIPAHGNQFQTNQPEHESDGRALLVCVLPMRKMWHFSNKIWSTLLQYAGTVMTSFYILSYMYMYMHMVTGSKQTNQSMNGIITHYFCACYQWERCGISAAKFDKHLSLYCVSIKLKSQTGLAYSFLWESCEVWFPKFTDNFGIVSLKIHFKAVAIFVPFITWRKMVRSVCLKPV